MDLTYTQGKGLFTFCVFILNKRMKIVLRSSRMKNKFFMARVTG